MSESTGHLVLDLLYQEAEEFEKALAVAMSDDLPGPIREMMDPDTAPEEMLPFLAQQESVDLWYEDWPTERKRQIIKAWPLLAQAIGTREAAARFLPYVDTGIVHKRSYPSRFPVGRIAAGRITPIQHPNYTARFLLKVDLPAPAFSVVIGRSAVGHAAIRTFNREPLRRAKRALSVSKAPETAYTVTFAHRIPVSLDDGLDLDAGTVLGSFRDRIRI
jgi:P2-related tail formation protein